jgi:hypothetical protein
LFRWRWEFFSFWDLGWDGIGVAFKMGLGKASPRGELVTFFTHCVSRVCLHIFLFLVLRVYAWFFVNVVIVLMCVQTTSS